MTCHKKWSILWSQSKYVHKVQLRMQLHVTYLQTKAQNNDVNDDTVTTLFLNDKQ